MRHLRKNTFNLNTLQLLICERKTMLTYQVQSTFQSNWFNLKLKRSNQNFCHLTVVTSKEIDTDKEYDCTNTEK